MAFPQLTREQMLERCDLAGLARVVTVGRASSDAPAVAKLVFTRIVKGAQRDRGGFVYVRLHRGGAADHDVARSLGGWSDRRDYPIGGMVMTHLDWNGPDEVYETTWPGAVKVVEAGIAQQVA